MLADPTTPGTLGGLALGWLLMLMPVGAPAPPEHAFPVRGETDYVAAHHDYPAVDVFAACGSAVLSPVDGTVLGVSRRDRWDARTDRGDARGGLSFSVRGTDGVRYYGSHLARLRPDLAPGVAVRAGEVVGRVGRTGSARPTACHLHVGISPVCDGVGPWWVRRGVVSPYRFLRAWERGIDVSPARTVAAWRRAHPCAGAG